jgi:hypothetical protein
MKPNRTEAKNHDRVKASMKRQLPSGTTWNTVALVLGAILTIGLPTAGHAAIQTFYGLDGGAGNGGAHPNSDVARSQFLAALGSYAVGTQDFEGFPGNGFGLIGQSVGFPSISATGLFGQPSGIGNAVVENDPSPEFPISGSNYVRTSIGPNRPFFDITFSEPVFGLGFYGVGVSDCFPASQRSTSTLTAEVLSGS